jgi:hypothetical protein
MTPVVVVAALGLVPFVALLACVVAHVLVSRAWPRLPRHHGVALGALAGLAGLAGLAWSFGSRTVDPADGAGLGVAWTLTYLALVYWYVFGFFNLGESARRIRLLVELHAAGERGLTLGELLAAYNASMIVDARLGRLLAGGQVVERDGRYFIGKPLMLCGAKALVLLKRVFLGGPSEFAARPQGSGVGRKG